MLPVGSTEGVNEVMVGYETIRMIVNTIGCCYIIYVLLIICSCTLLFHFEMYTCPAKITTVHIIIQTIYDTFLNQKQLKKGHLYVSG